jgi:hypothetical protein
MIKYVKPKIVKVYKMDFPIKIIEKLGNNTVCKQCSACHSCR